jgi:serine/threonine protein kinase
MQLPPAASSVHAAHDEDDDNGEAATSNALPLRVESTEDIAEDVALASILSRKKSDSYDDDGFEDLSTSSDDEIPVLLTSEGGEQAGRTLSPTPAPNTTASERRSSTNGPTSKARFNADNVVKKERVGRGTFGDVFRGVDTSNGNEVAIKEIVVAQDAGKDLEKQIHTLEREIRVMQKLDHPNTVKYFGARRHCDALHIYMEYVSGGTLASLLRAKGPLSEEEARKLTIQLVKGLAYLHGRNIIHRDLKGDNLFMDEKGNLKVGDFGTSKELATVKITNSVAGTPNFMAPEVVTCAGHSLAADVWSVGCCVVQMLSGKAPFANVDNHMAVMFAVMKGSIREQIPPNITPLARSFIVACVKMKPEERLTCEELLKHPWLAEEEPVTPVDRKATPPPQPPEPSKDGLKTATPEVPKSSPRITSAHEPPAVFSDAKKKPVSPPPPKSAGASKPSPPPSSSGETAAVRPVIALSLKHPVQIQNKAQPHAGGPRRTSSDLGKKPAPAVDKKGKGE